MTAETVGVDGTPAWAYCEDGYCVACGNGRWKHHMPNCELRDGLDSAAIVRDLATLETPFDDLECHFCDADRYRPDVDGVEILVGDHDETCVYRRAVELEVTSRPELVPPATSA